MGDALTTRCILDRQHGRVEVVEIQPDAVVGPFAIHQHIRQRKAQGPGWVVTHQELGAVVWRVASFAEALRVAQWLVERQLIPEGREACLAWRAALSEPERAELLAQLHGVAPRLVPEPMG